MGVCMHLDSVTCDNCRPFQPSVSVPTLPGYRLVPVVQMPGDLVKCPECGIWWRGVEHRCAPNGDGTFVVWSGNTSLPRAGTNA